MPTQTYVSIPWLLETRLLGLADGACLEQAAADFRAKPKANWLVDATYVEDYNQLSLLNAVGRLGDLADYGLKRIVVIIGEEAQMAVGMIENATGVQTTRFDTRDAAVAWLKGGCKS